MPSFTDLRVKLHGQPEPEDLRRVKEFYARHRDNIHPVLDSMFRSLEKELDTFKTLHVLHERTPLNNYKLDISTEGRIVSTSSRWHSSVPGV